MVGAKLRCHQPAFRRMAVEVNVARAWPAARLAKQDMVSSPETRAARPSKGASVSLRHLSKHYGRSIAVDAIDLEIAAGEFVTFLGPSGSGKTTTLSMIAGFTPVSSGQILLGNQPIEMLPPYRRDIGMVFQSYSLFPHMTVAENVAFPLRRRSVSRAEIKSRVGRVLDLIQLGDKGGRYPRELSGGQQQRVALARAIVFEPQLLLMDEPLGALDKKLREQMQLEIKRLHKELAITFVFVTHDQEEALVMSDRIAVFEQGRLAQVGTPGDLYERPRSLFVADFLGDSNILKGTAAVQGGEWRLCSPCGTFIADAVEPGMVDGASAAITVRPEQLRIHVNDAPCAAQDVNQVEGRVSQIVYLGASRKVEVSLSDGSRLHVREQAREQSTLHEGAAVRVSWAASCTMLLSCGNRSSVKTAG
ncbi:ABC transporter ATP-binding protein [Variovorax sp. LjRoot178]|uniref:ABC transporter ATP-binding protein n=1 Tax=Variovorax sp. LjRoot178 TaxID=3342277 RepID=UPI003ECE8732